MMNPIIEKYLVLNKTDRIMLWDAATAGDSSTTRDVFRAHFRQLQKALSGVPGLRVIDASHPKAESSFYCLTLVLEGPLADKRNAAVARLNAAGVGTSVYYPQPVPRMTYYRTKYGYDSGRHPNATQISDQSIALPVGPHLNEDDMTYIAEHVKRVARELCA